MMGLLDFLKIHKNNVEKMEELSDIMSIDKITANISQKKIAIQSATNLIGKLFSQCEFRVRNSDGYYKDKLYYRLNVCPNVNQSSVEFWQKAIHKLLNDNEVLIVQVNDQLLIADTFDVVRFTVKDNVYKNVVVGDFVFKKAFIGNEVIHVKYSNDRLIKLVDSMYSDYGELLDSVIKSQRRAGNLRGIFKYNGQQQLSSEAVKRMQTVVDKTTIAFTNKDVAIIPLGEGFDYSEIKSNEAHINQVDEANNVYLKIVALALNIPFSLLTGDVSKTADMDGIMNQCFKLAIKPLLNLFVQEMNCKFFDEEEYLEGHEILVSTNQLFIDNIFAQATSIDKLIASGLVTINEIRDELGYLSSKDKIADEHILTKNYDVLQKGGDEDGKEIND